MSDPVDLSNLRDLVDDDVELEKSLFAEFYLNGDTLLAAMRASLASGDNNAWRSAAHALKGVSLNLGAFILSNLCKEGQDSYQSPNAEKAALLAKMEDSFAVAKTYLQSL